MSTFNIETQVNGITLYHIKESDLLLSAEKFDFVYGVAATMIIKVKCFNGASMTDWKQDGTVVVQVRHPVKAAKFTHDDGSVEPILERDFSGNVILGSPYGRVMEHQNVFDNAGRMCTSLIESAAVKAYATLVGLRLPDVDGPKFGNCATCFNRRSEVTRSMSTGDITTYGPYEAYRGRDVCLACDRLETQIDQDIRRATHIWRYSDSDFLPYQVMLPRRLRIPKIRRELKSAYEEEIKATKRILDDEPSDDEDLDFSAGVHIEDPEWSRQEYGIEPEDLDYAAMAADIKKLAGERNIPLSAAKVFGVDKLMALLHLPTLTSILNNTPDSDTRVNQDCEWEVYCHNRHEDGLAPQDTIDHDVMELTTITRKFSFSWLYQHALLDVGSNCPYYCNYSNKRFWLRPQGVAVHKVDKTTYELIAGPVRMFIDRGQCLILDQSGRYHKKAAQMNALTTTAFAKRPKIERMDEYIMENNKIVEVELYTDGACSGNPGPGGWAYILRIPSMDFEKRMAGFVKDTTNNRMEMQAIIEGFKSLKIACSVKVYSDSNLVINQAKGDWKRNKNLDLWEELTSLIGKHSVSWNWVKGHASNALNNECDKMATSAIKNGGVL